MGNPDPINAWHKPGTGRAATWRTMGDMTEPATASQSEAKPMLDREALAARLLYEEGSEWAEGTDRHYELADVVMEMARPVPSREAIMSAMIGAIYEDPEPYARQGMPQQEWELLSIAADAVVKLLNGAESA